MTRLQLVNSGVLPHAGKGSQAHAKPAGPLCLETAEEGCADAGDACKRVQVPVGGRGVGFGLGGSQGSDAAVPVDLLVAGRVPRHALVKLLVPSSRIRSRAGRATSGNTAIHE